VRQNKLSGTEVHHAHEKPHDAQQPIQEAAVQERRQRPEEADFVDCGARVRAPRDAVNQGSTWGSARGQWEGRAKKRTALCVDLSQPGGFGGGGCTRGSAAWWF
jgi:hypothetical protein